MEVAIQRLEPFGGVARAVLELQHLEIALGLIFGERGIAGEARAAQHLGKLDRIFERELGARSDREMRGVGGIAEQDEIAVAPGAADDPAELQPRPRPGQVRRVRQEGMAVQVTGEDPLAMRDRLALLHPVEPEPGPGVRVHLDDEGAHPLIEAIGVRPDPAGLGLLEREGEGLERFGRPEPEELVAAHLDVDVEMLGVAVADAAVRTVGGDDEIIAGPVVEIGARLMFEMQHDAEIARPRLEKVQQALATDADEAVAGRADRLAMDMDFDIVPMREFRGDRRAGDRIVRHQVLDRLVGEDDAPAERVVGPVAFEDVDVVRRIAQLHRDREIEPGGPPAEASDAHSAFPRFFSLKLSRRFAASRGTWTARLRACLEWRMHDRRATRGAARRSIVWLIEDRQKATLASMPYVRGGLKLA